MESTKFKTLTVTSVLTGLSLASLALPGVAVAEKVQNANTIAEALGEKSFHNLNLRLRHEHVKDKEEIVGTQLKSASLNSLRTQLTYGTGAMCDTSAQATVTNVTTFAGTKKHNPGFKRDGNDVGNTAHAEINDPRGTALNELFIANTSIPDTQIKVGDQFISLDNERFFGKEDHRQNPQSYRGVTVTNNSLADTTLTYGYVTNLLKNTRTTTADASQAAMKSHIFHIAWEGVDFAKVSAYDYQVKVKDKADQSDKNLSSNTYGLRISGDKELNSKDFSVNYDLEWAKQKGKYNNPVKYSASFWGVGLGASMNGFDLGVRHERLGGKANEAGKQFRFAGSTHEFLGKADAIGSPDAGVKDTMLALGYTYDQCKAKLDYHQFKPQNGGGSKLGTEWDLSVGYDFAKNYNVSVAYAKFKAKDTAFKDVTKYWLTLGASF